MYVCLHTCIYTCMDSYMSAYMHTHTYIYSSTHKYIILHVSLHTYLDTYSNNDSACLPIYMYMHGFLPQYMCRCIHTYMVHAHILKIENYACLPA